MDRGLSTADLASAANQLSPKDLFTAIPDANKGTDCKTGTNFTDALDVLLNRGVATQASVPYDLNAGCSQSNSQSSWTAEAANHKIKNYRKIDVSIASFKTELANNQPIVIGAELSDNFSQWNNDGVLSSNTTYDHVGIHARHALICAGYDDAKGPNGAFKVINSWGTTWGDQGYIWIDQNFMVNSFIFGGNAYIATNLKSNGAPTPDPVQNGNADLAAWVNFDNPVSGTTRTIDFNIYNIGTQTVSAATGWAVYYIMYDAYNANNYTVLFKDEANQSATSISCSQVMGVNTCTYNADLAGGATLGATLFGGTSSIQNTYDIPVTANGSYYLLIYADPLNVVTENDKANNLFYTTPQYPVTVLNGVVTKTDEITLSNFTFNNAMSATLDVLKKNSFHTAITDKNKNAYAPDEIKEFFKQEIRNGNYKNKMAPSANAGGMSAGH